jgi:dTDP-4-dehydrorhamnose reductase
MSASSVLLLGANGQLGWRLARSLSPAGYEVTALDRAACDLAIADQKAIEVKLRAVEPQLIINAAAYTAVDRAETETELAMRVNAHAPELLAKVAQAYGVPFIHFSTDYVFDGAAGKPYNEAVPPRPLGTYGRSKLAGEQAVYASGGYVFRLQWVYGGTAANFFTTMTKLLREKSELRVVADQLGAPSFAGHIAKAVTASLPLVIAKKLPADIYHLTAAGYTSWHGFTCAIAEGMGSQTRILPITTAEYPTSAARPQDTRLDCRKLAAYGINMPHWREGLAARLAEWKETQ